MLSLIPNFSFHYGNLGFGSAIAYFIAKNKISAKLSLEIVWIVGTLLSIISTGILLAVWQLHFSPLNDIRPDFIFLYLPTIPLTFFNNYMQRILSGKLRIPEINFGALLGYLTGLIMLSILVIVHNMGIKGAIFSVLANQTVTFCYLFWVLNKKKDDEKKLGEYNTDKIEMVISFWRYGRWNYLLMFSNYLKSQLPLIFLKNFSLNAIPVGYYSKAIGLGEQSQIVSDSISKVLFPFTAASVGDKAKNRTDFICRNSIILMFFIVLLMMFFAKPLINILYGEAFLPAVNIFYMFAPSIIFWPCSQFLSIHVAASGNPKGVFLVGLCTLFLTVIVCIIFVGNMGAIGAGLSVGITSIFSMSLRLILYMKSTGASFSDVLLPKRDDWSYYREVLISINAKIIRFKRKVIP
ncbi:MAG: hypothetical protein KAS87_02675 [Candidatus Omnitrophica bacterium]|nr:hypothetical protein [Candidatus Omnitrophota bacterium]